MKQFIALMLLVSIGLAQEPKNPVNIVSDSLVLPNVVADYAANDVVTDTLTSYNKILAFKYSARNAKGTGIIVSATIETDTGSTTNGSFRLILFRDTVTSAANNAAFVGAHASNAIKIGEINFSLDMNQTAGAGTAMGITEGLVIPFVASGRLANGYIYGVLIAKAAYKPKQLGKVRIKLGIIRD